MAGVPHVACWRQVFLINQKPWTQRQGFASLVQLLVDFGTAGYTLPDGAILPF